MVNTISFDVNNGGKMELTQREHDGSCLISTLDEKGLCNNLLNDKEAFISNGDMVMLLNYWVHVKRNDIQNDFINPNGKNHENRVYIFKDGTMQGSTATRGSAIDLIRRYQEMETHPVLRAEFSIIEGKEEIIKYEK